MLLYIIYFFIYIQNILYYIAGRSYRLLVDFKPVKFCSPTRLVHMLMNGVFFKDKMAKHFLILENCDFYTLINMIRCITFIRNFATLRLKRYNFRKCTGKSASLR